MARRVVVRAGGSGCVRWRDRDVLYARGKDEVCARMSGVECVGEGQVCVRSTSKVEYLVEGLACPV